MRKSFLLFILFSSSLLFNSCERDNDPQTPPAAPKTKTEILAAKPWVTQETYILENNTLTKYERGATGNTANYDNETVTFNTNGTGIFKDIFGGTIPFTWSFTDAQQTKMRLVLQYQTGNNNLDYFMVNIADGVFSGTLTYVLNGTRTLASFRRVQLP